VIIISQGLLAVRANPATFAPAMPGRGRLQKAVNPYFKNKNINGKYR
jgi:hypothetical protein